MKLMRLRNKSWKRGLILVFLLNMFCLKSRAATHHVTIMDAFYVPDQLAISVGDTVIWTNVDNTEHSVTSTEGEGARKCE